MDTETQYRLEIVNVSGCRKNLVVEVPPEEIDREIEELALGYAKKAKVPGFRPGKVPLNVIKQRYAAELRGEAVQDVIKHCLGNAFKEHKFQPLSEPAVKDLQDKPGLPLKFTVTFEIFPELDVKDYKGIAATLDQPQVDEAEVDKALEALRGENAQFVPVEEGEVRDGHHVTLNILGDLEGVSKPLKEDDVVVVVGGPETDEHFSAHLRGARLGETRSFDVSYPPEYHRRRFAGKRVRYTVTVKDIKEEHLAELNDDFAKDLGMENLPDLRNKVRDDLITNARRVAEKKAREAVLDTVVQNNAFDVPDSLVQEELEAHARRIAAGLARQGVDVNKTSINWKKVFEEERPRSELAVRRSLILAAIARQEGIEVSEQEIGSELQKIAEVSQKSVAAIRAQFEKDKRIQGFTEQLRQNKALDFIYRNANISGG